MKHFFLHIFLTILALGVSSINGFCQLTEKEQEELGENSKKELLQGGWVDRENKNNEKVSKAYIQKVKNKEWTFQKFTEENLKRVQPIGEIPISINFDWDKFYKLKKKNPKKYFKSWEALYEDVNSRIKENEATINEIDPYHATQDLQNLKTILGERNMSYILDGLGTTLENHLRESSSAAKFMEGLPDLVNPKKLNPAFRNAKESDKKDQENLTPPTEEQKQLLKQLLDDNKNLSGFWDQLTSDLSTRDCQKCIQKIKENEK